MTRLARLRCLLALSLTASLCAGVGAAQVLSAQELLPERIEQPEEFGTKDYTVTTISALSFSGGSFNVSGSLGRFGQTNVDQHFYATLNMPNSAVIDRLGLDNFNDGTPGIMSVTLWRRTILGAKVFLGSIANSAHASWDVDRSSNAAISAYGGGVLILDVEIASSPNLQFFGYVEVWWRRTVSPSPATASFTDVPTTHPFFQFVEALHAAGITNGYPDGRYGVNDPVTRGQMAVYLAAALGLHWPY